MSAEIFDMKLYKKALKLAKKGKSLKIKPQSNVEYEGEKQIEIDAKQICALQKQNGEPTDKVKKLEVRCNELFLQTCEQAEKIKELEAQIEKMKCCANCMYEPPFDKHCDKCIQGTIKLRYRNWNLRGIKENENVT